MQTQSTKTLQQAYRHLQHLPKVEQKKYLVWLMLWFLQIDSQLSKKALQVLKSCQLISGI